jgi:hypothetical protein
MAAAIAAAHTLVLSVSHFLRLSPLRLPPLLLFPA